MPIEATAPGSLTTVFVPRSGEEGSLGVSVAIEDGVTVSVEDAPETRIALDGAPTEFEPVALLLEDLGLAARVDIDASIPVGRGFGASGAATLATALAAAERFELELSRDELVAAAHRAELAAGTGQGDVFVQARGGMVYNTGEGIGRRERTDPLSYTSLAGIETAAVLGDEPALARIAAAGRDALQTFDPDGPFDEWLDTAWTFAQRTGLVTEEVAETVRTVQDAGGAATMAMVGESVVASGADGVLAEATAITPRGARVL